MSSKKADSNLNMIVLTENWLSFVQLRMSEAAYRTYRIAVNGFVKQLPPRISPSDITPLHIEQYIQRLIANGRTRKTANTYLTALRSFYHWAETYYNIVDRAKPVSLLKEGKKTVRILSDNEYQAILTTVPKGPKHDMFQFLANTGLRIGEFFALRWSDFRETDYVSICGKGGKIRSVPLNIVCKTIIGRNKSYDYRCQAAPSFVTCLKRSSAIYKLCQTISQKAKIAPFTPHAFRHYFATRLIKAGIPLVVVSKILGHASAQFTEKVYVHLVPTDYHGVTNVLEF